jgi:MYXO-CTERM domain-containing protein
MKSFMAKMVAVSALLITGGAQAELVSSTVQMNNYIHNGTYNGTHDFSSLLDGLYEPEIHSATFTFNFNDDAEAPETSSSTETSESTDIDYRNAYDCQGNGSQNCGWKYYHTRTQTTSYYNEVESGTVSIFGLTSDYNAPTYDYTHSNGTTQDYRYDDSWDDDHYTTTHKYSRYHGAKGAFSASITVVDSVMLADLLSGTVDFVFDSVGDYTLTSMSTSMDVTESPYPVPAPAAFGVLGLGLLAFGRRKMNR